MSLIIEQVLAVMWAKVQEAMSDAAFGDSLVISELYRLLENPELPVRLTTQ